MTRSLSLLLICLAGTGFAQGDAPRAVDRRSASELVTAAAVPALESVFTQFGFLAFNSLITQMPFTLISRDTIARNLTPSAWAFDTDFYETNQLGHPYQGALTFTAARSASLSFWWSVLYTTLGSLAWELFFENEAPSINDQVTTTLGGAFLGESLHRAARQLRNGAGPRWLRWFGATVLDPLGSVNAALLGEPLEESPLDESPMTTRWQLGARTLVVATEPLALQGVASVVLVSGAPWDPHATAHQPFSYFDLRGEIAVGPSQAAGKVMIRGLLGGRRFEAPGLAGVWGVFGHYDFSAPSSLRTSSVGVGPGVAAQFSPAGAGFVVQGWAQLGGSPFAAAGERVGAVAGHERDYHIGPGAQAAAELRLLTPRFQFEVVGRTWLVVGAYEPQGGYEWLTQLTVGGSVSVAPWLSVGASGTSSRRMVRFDGPVATQEQLTVQLNLTLSTEPSVGEAP